MMSNIFNDEIMLTLFNEAFYELIDDGMSEVEAEVSSYSYCYAEVGGNGMTWVIVQQCVKIVVDMVNYMVIILHLIQMP